MYIPTILNIFFPRSFPFDYGCRPCPFPLLSSVGRGGRGQRPNARQYSQYLLKRLVVIFVARYVHVRFRISLSWHRFYFLFNPIPPLYYASVSQPPSPFFRINTIFYFLIFLNRLPPNETWTNSFCQRYLPVWVSVCALLSWTHAYIILCCAHSLSNIPVVLYPIRLCVSVIGNNVNWGVSGIEGETDLNDLQDTVKKKLGSLAPGLPNLEQFNESIPALDEGERVLKEKCLKNSQSNDSYEMTVVSHLVFLCFYF